MGNFNKLNIDFCRQALIEKMTRPAPLIVLFPRNTGNTKLQLQINSNTSINIRYIAEGSETVNSSIVYTNKSVGAIVQEINKLSLPLSAVGIASVDVLRSGDLIQLGSNYLDLPSGFNVYDRTSGNGILIRGKKVLTRHKSDSKIKLLDPYQELSTLPWYPRILNGSFTKKHNGLLYHFYIPEYESQSWSPEFGKPFKQVLGERLVAVDKNTYRVFRTPIYWNGENITLYNDDIPLSKNIIKDVDIHNGFLFLDPSFNVSGNIRVDYTYNEPSYVYKDININGHFSQNPLILDKFVIIYMLPVEASTFSTKKTIYHIVGDSIESAIDSIEIANPEIPIAIIGAYNIRPIISSDQINILDTRSKGGGLIRARGQVSPVYYFQDIIESDDIDVESVYQESYRFWDIGNMDGLPYPAAAAVSMELPEELKDVLPISDIKKKASKFIAAGVYPSISFYNAKLPAIEGLSRQVSCTYNLDFSELYNKYSTSNSGVIGTVPTSFTGIGWRQQEPSTPGSIFTANWSSYYPELPIVKSQGKNLLEISNEPIGFTYLKSSPIAGISWFERSVLNITGNIDVPSEYSNWTKKTIFDNLEVVTGELTKQYFFINPEGIKKQYRDIVVHSPYQITDLKSKIEKEVSSIFDNILELQTSGYDKTLSSVFNTAIKTSYSNVLNKNEKQSISDYVLVPSVYSTIADIYDTPLKELYAEELDKIGKDILAYGVYTSGHYFRYFLQPSSRYYDAADGTPVALFDFNSSLKFINKYLDFRNTSNSWDQSCETGSLSSTGLVTRLINSANLFGDFGPGVPLYWYYYPTKFASGITNDYFSGYYIPTVSSVGTTYSEIVQSKNYDYLYTQSMPSIFSSVLANTGNTDLSTSFLNSIKETYEYCIDNVINNVDQTVNGIRYYSGLPTTSHWFVSHNKLGTYLGYNLKNIIESYEYLYKYNINRKNIYDITQPQYAGPSYLDYMFSGIEKILETSYDVVYNNVLRLGVTEPEMAYTLYGYGWYINNWINHYGLKGKVYSIDNRDKYYYLFDRGLKQVIKNHFTEDNKFLEIKSILGEPGSFPALTPSKVLYPLAEAIKMDKEAWEGIAEGVVTTIINNYGVSGLYYSNPYKTDTIAGKELDIVDGLIKIYKSLTTPSSNLRFEPVNYKLSNVRGCFFRPNFSSYDNAAPTGDWQGTTNSLSFWKYYSSGDVESSIVNLKSIGINTLFIDLDYILWKTNSGLFYSNLDHLFETCTKNRISIIPNFINDYGTTITQANFTSYVTTFGHTGGQYRPECTDSVFFMTGVMSGQAYVESLINRYDNNPSLIAWSIVSNPISTGTNLVNYSSIIYITDTKTDTPIIYNTSSPISIGDMQFTKNQLPSATKNPFEIQYSAIPIYSQDIYANYPGTLNPRVDIVGTSPNSYFSYFLDNLPSIGNKKYLITNYGDGEIGDYSLSINRLYYRGLPFILSDLYVKSGKAEGIIYENLDCRIARHAVSIQEMATYQKVSTTGKPIQIIDFSDKYFYNVDYIPGYNGNNLISDILNWNNRLTSNILSNDQTGEFLKQIKVLTSAQKALDTLNNNLYKDSYYQTILDPEEKNNLDFYRTRWDFIDFTKNTATPVLVSGQLDKQYYDSFITDWGMNLKSICNRLNING